MSKATHQDQEAMKILQANYFWLALLSLTEYAFSQKADCGDGLTLDVQQGDPFTFSIPLNQTCSAALATFSDGSDFILDPHTNTSCHRPGSTSQTFTTVIGTDVSRGMATMTFQCGGEVYCISINVAEGNGSESRTSISGICTNSTNQARESSGGSSGSILLPTAAGGTAYEGSVESSTSAVMPFGTSPATQGSLGASTAMLGNSTGFSTIRGTNLPGTDPSVTGLESIDGIRTTSKTTSGMTDAGSAYATSQASPDMTDDTGLTDSVLATSLPYSPYAQTSQAATIQAISSQTSMTTSVLQTLAGSGIAGPNSTAVVDSTSPLQSGDVRASSTAAAGQDPSTCACFPLPSLL